jgi:hypothetical protein
LYDRWQKRIKDTTTSKTNAEIIPIDHLKARIWKSLSSNILSVKSVKENGSVTTLVVFDIVAFWAKLLQML